MYVWEKAGIYARSLGWYLICERNIKTPVYLKNYRILGNFGFFPWCCYQVCRWQQIGRLSGGAAIQREQAVGEMQVLQQTKTLSPGTWKEKQIQVEDGKYSVEEHVASQIESLLECHSGLCSSGLSYVIWESDTYIDGKIYSDIKLLTSLMIVNMNLTANSSLDQWPWGGNRIHFLRVCREKQSQGQIDRLSTGLPFRDT